MSTIIDIGMKKWTAGKKDKIILKYILTFKNVCDTVLEMRVKGIL